MLLYKTLSKVTQQKSLLRLYSVLLTDSVILYSVSGKRDGQSRGEGGLGGREDAWSLHHSAQGEASSMYIPSRVHPSINFSFTFRWPCWLAPAWRLLHRAYVQLMICFIYKLS